MTALEEMLRPTKSTRMAALTKLYKHFLKRYFPTMPPCRVGIDYRDHQHVLGSYSETHGIVIRKNPVVIANQENLALVLLHEMTHQYLHFCGVDVDPDGNPHTKQFRDILTVCLENEFPGQDFKDVVNAGLNY